MRISRVRIENFRSIKHLDVELGDTTVFIGPNNSGKTAILDAVRIALTRRWGQRGTGFTEYDIHLASETDDPKASPGVAIEVRAEEGEAGEWPDALHQASHARLAEGGERCTKCVSCCSPQWRVRAATQQ